MSMALLFKPRSAGAAGLALRRAWVAWRIGRIATFMQRERALHHMHMAQLRAELDALQLRQALLHAGAAGAAQDAVQEGAP
jgi:hypothetical protein